ncbi:hypothetical protein D3C80_1469030 [compost metagenome]
MHRAVDKRPGRRYWQHTEQLRDNPLGLCASFERQAMRSAARSNAGKHLFNRQGCDCLAELFAPLGPGACAQQLKQRAMQRRQAGTLVPVQAYIDHPVHFVTPCLGRWVIAERCRRRIRVDQQDQVFLQSLQQVCIHGLGRAETFIASGMLCREQAVKLFVHSHLEQGQQLQLAGYRKAAQRYRPASGQ